MKVTLLTISILFFSLANKACTMCNSKQAIDVRALVFGEDFHKNVFFTVLPFLAFTVIVGFIYKSGERVKYKN